MILVDTSVWVDFLRGEDSSQRRLFHRLIEDEADISMTEIIFTEILQGIKNDGEFQAIRDYLLEFPLYTPKGIETYLHAARIYRNCRKKVKTVRRTIDCIIAAICIENDLTLLHKDSDFDLIQACTGLQVIQV
ncbi:MAG: PIN domain nuclease [candidate division NC10 bacterium]|nr:PIN domain nuclease [candidate division NC10 bacterium]MDE2321038.1 PIN domain nuclease [candidate division NC10 bacterium]